MLNFHELWELTEARINLPADMPLDQLRQNWNNQAYLNQKQAAPQSVAGAMGNAALQAGVSVAKDAALDAIPGGKLAAGAMSMASNFMGGNDIAAKAQKVGLPVEALQITNPKINSVLNGNGMQLVQKIASNPKNISMYQKYGPDYINAVAREWITSMIGGTPSGMLGEVDWGQVGKSAAKTAADFAADFVPGGGAALNTVMGAYNTAKAGMDAYQQNAQQQQMLQQGQQAGIPANALQSWNPNIKSILDGSSIPKIQNIAVNPTNAKQYQKLGNGYMDMIATAYIKQAIQAQK